MFRRFEYAMHYKSNNVHAFADRFIKYVFLFIIILDNSVNLAIKLQKTNAK